MHKNLFLLSLIFAASLCAATHAHAAASSDPCQAGNLVICNLQIPMASNPVGFKAIMTVPSPYQHERFTVECMGSTNGSFGYEILDADKVHCKLETCPALPVEICGYDIPTPGGTVVGETVKLDIPTSFINPPALSKHPTVTATCVDPDGKPRYEAKDYTGSACANFACPPAKIAICDSFINIAEYGENGSVKDITLSPPFEPQTFKVQCLARNDHAPAYEILEQKNITCKKAQ